MDWNTGVDLVNRMGYNMTGTSLEALQKIFDSVIIIDLLPPYPIISIQECMASI